MKGIGRRGINRRVVTKGTRIVGRRKRRRRRRKRRRRDMGGGGTPVKVNRRSPEKY